MSSASGALTSVTHLFIVTAAIEVGAGLTLLAAPAVVIRLLFGSAVDVFPAAGIARLTGAALLSLGAACWWARHEERSAASRALVGALLIYNAAAVALVIVGALGALGPLQWAAVVLHGALAIWCGWIVADQRR
jgi:FtsH-binding integral membrane protein